MTYLTHRLMTRFLFKKPFYGKSLTQENRLNFMSCLMEKVIYEGVNGDVIECGVYRGGSLRVLATKLKQLISDKILFGLDTFEGHPYTDEGSTHIKGRYNDTDFNKINVVMDELGLTNVKLLKGKFIDVLPSLKNKRFCFAYLDCDLYQSYKDCLKFILPRLNKGGVIYFDDYNSKSTKGFSDKAIHEFISKNDLVKLPKCQAYYVKNAKKRGMRII